MTENYLIETKNLCFSYEKNSPMILKDINIRIPKGIYLSIVGENGSCKTTFIKLLLNLLKPVSGSINIHTNNVSYVPQRLDGFNSSFPISVYEILKCHCKALNIDVNKEINSALEKVNMLDHKNSLIGNLSGGQQQRVFIARALMGNTDLIILDEPSTGVDYKNQVEIYSLLSDINKKFSTTIISVEHNLSMALKYSTHILKFDEGKLSLNSIESFKDYIKEGEME